MIDKQRCALDNDFTAIDAATLILGIDPETATDNESKQYNKLLKRMHDCFELAISYFLDCLEDKASLEPPPTMLVSTGLQIRVKQLWGSSPDFWLDNEENYVGFENQKFSRNELDRWVSAIGLTSSYPFVPKKLTAIAATEKSAKPLNAKIRKTLLLINLGIVKIWYDYDYKSLAATIACQAKKDLNVCGIDVPEEFIKNRLEESYDLHENIMKSNGDYKVNFDMAFLNETEFNTLLLMLIGLARACYSYDPLKAKSPTPPVIQKNLQTVAIDVSDDTIRNYLKKAYQLEKSMQ